MSVAGHWVSVGQALDAAGPLAPGEYLRWETVERQAGDVLAPSRQYRDGDLTGRLLTGTSALDPRVSQSPADRAGLYEGRVYVIAGKRLRRGQDRGEVILQSPVVRRAVTV